MHSRYKSIHVIKNIGTQNLCLRVYTPPYTHHPTSQPLLHAKTYIAHLGPFHTVTNKCIYSESFRQHIHRRDSGGSYTSYTSFPQPTPYSNSESALALPEPTLHVAHNAASDRPHADTSSTRVEGEERVSVSEMRHADTSSTRVEGEERVSVSEMTHADTSSTRIEGEERVSVSEMRHADTSSTRIEGEERVSVSEMRHAQARIAQLEQLVYMLLDRTVGTWEGWVGE